MGLIRNLLGLSRRPSVISGPQIVFERLEDRIVLDASIAPTVQGIEDVQAPDHDSGTEAASESDQQPDQQPDQDAGADDPTRILVVASNIDGFSGAIPVEDGVVVVSYDYESDSSQLLHDLKQEVGEETVESIGFVTHSSNGGRFQLTQGTAVSVASISSNDNLKSFWQEIGGLLSEEGRIDLFACDLASTREGMTLISTIESLSSHDVAASDDATGNSESGGDWVLEKGNVNLVGTYFTSSGLESFSGVLAETEYKLTPPAGHGHSDDLFGYGVSVYQDRAVVGGTFLKPDPSSPSHHGDAYVYDFDGTNWNATQELSTSRPGVHWYGLTTSVFGDTAVVGGLYTDYQPGVPGHTNNGSAHVFELQGGTWVEQKVLFSDVPLYTAEFSRGLCVYEDWIIVGAPYDVYDPSTQNYLAGTGAVYFFERDAGGPDNWGLVQKIVASDAQQGDHFGYSVSVSHDTMIVGSKWDDTARGVDSGEAYFFTFDHVSNQWVEQQRVVGGDVGPGDHFGQSCSIWGDTAIVTADYQNSREGSAYFYHYDSGTGTWVEERKITASDGAAGDRYGRYAAVYDEYAVVGAYKHGHGGLTKSGSAYVYRYDGGAWAETEELLPSDSQAHDRFGNTLGLYDNRVIVGAPTDLVPDRPGAAYIFDLEAPEPPSPSGPSVVTPPVPYYPGEGMEFSGYPEYPNEVGLFHWTPDITAYEPLDIDSLLREPVDQSEGGGPWTDIFEAKYPTIDIDELRVCDILDCYVPVRGPEEPVTGLYGYPEEVAAGKALAFNYEERQLLEQLFGDK